MPSRPQRGRACLASPSVRPMATSGMLAPVSDGYLRLIPTVRDWQPPQEDAVAATAYAENTTRVSCSACGGDMGAEWLSDLIESNGVSFDSLDVSAPCCGRVVGVDSLRYDWPVGFARFEICAMNPTRAKYELDTEELHHLAALL